MIAESASTPLRRILVPIGAAILALAAMSRGPAQAETRTFIIEAHEGYGIMDCMVDGVDCGKVVANSWCESQGLGPAVAFGRASDITGAIPEKAADAAPTKKIAPDAIVVSCAE